MSHATDLRTSPALAGRDDRNLARPPGRSVPRSPGMPRAPPGRRRERRAQLERGLARDWPQSPLRQPVDGMDTVGQLGNR
eukprot:1112241-Pyramimonas_sp.AAC.1